MSEQLWRPIYLKVKNYGVLIKKKKEGGLTDMMHKLAITAVGPIPVSHEVYDIL